MENFSHKECIDRESSKTQHSMSENLEGVKIRPYTEADIEQLEEVIHSMQTEDPWPHYYPNGWDREKIRSEFDPMRKYEDSLFVVSEEGNHLTGLIAGHELDGFVDQEIPHLKEEFGRLGLYHSDSFYQRDIIIHKNHIKTTLAIQLFEALKKYAVEAGYKTLVTRTPPLNTRGIKFFGKLGYQEILENDKPERIYFKMDIKGK